MKLSTMFGSSGATKKGLEEDLEEFNRISDEALKLDTDQKYGEAIQAYTRAQDSLSAMLEKYRKKVLDPKQGVTFQRQLALFRSRQAYLTHLSQNNDLNSVVALPTRFSVTQVLRDETSISRKQRSLGRTLTSLALDNDFSQKQTESTPLSWLIRSELSPVEYHVRHEIDNLPHRKWIDCLIVSHAATQQALWLMATSHVTTHMFMDTCLQRAGEIMPGDKAVSTRMYRAGNHLVLRMQSQATGWNLEQTDRAKELSDWAPRRFRYGERQFVWKPHENWEALFETAWVSKVENSKSGKMNEETIGNCLCWGLETEGEKKSMAATIYFLPGLDQGFVEHCLASLLSRWQRQRYPAPDDTHKRKALLVGGVIGRTALATATVGGGMGAYNA